MMGAIIIYHYSCLHRKDQWRQSSFQIFCTTDDRRFWPEKYALTGYVTTKKMKW